MMYEAIVSMDMPLFSCVVHHHYRPAASGARPSDD
jgi:hypothetical protein